LALQGRGLKWWANRWSFEPSLRLSATDPAIEWCVSRRLKARNKAASTKANGYSMIRNVTMMLQLIVTLTLAAMLGGCYQKADQVWTDGQDYLVETRLDIRQNAVRDGKLSAAPEPVLLPKP